MNKSVISYLPNCTYHLLYRNWNWAYFTWNNCMFLLLKALWSFKFLTVQLLVYFFEWESTVVRHQELLWDTKFHSTVSLVRWLPLFLELVCPILLPRGLFQADALAPSDHGQVIQFSFRFWTFLVRDCIAFFYWP